MEINVDIGGTFTDCFASDGQRVASAKALTTHHDLAHGFMTAVEDLAESFELAPGELLREHRGDPLRDHPRHQRADRAHRPATGPADHDRASRTSSRSAAAAATARASPTSTTATSPAPSGPSR